MAIDISARQNAIVQLLAWGDQITAYGRLLRDLLEDGQRRRVPFVLANPPSTFLPYVLAELLEILIARQESTEAEALLSQFTTPSHQALIAWRLFRNTGKKRHLDKARTALALCQPMSPFEAWLSLKFYKNYLLSFDLQKARLLGGSKGSSVDTRVFALRAVALQTHETQDLDALVQAIQKANDLIKLVTVEELVPVLIAANSFDAIMHFMNILEDPLCRLYAIHLTYDFRAAQP